MWRVALLMAEPDLSLSNQLRQRLLSELVGPFWMPTFLPNTLFLCLCTLHTDLLLWESCVAFLPHYLCFSVLLSYESGSSFSWEAWDFLRWMALERFDPGMSRFLLGMECIQCLVSFLKSHTPQRDHLLVQLRSHGFPLAGEHGTPDYGPVTS